MKVHTLADGDPSRPLARLATQVDRLDREIRGLAHLRADVETNTRTLHDLLDLVRRLTTTTTGGLDELDLLTAVPEWLTVTDPMAAVAWMSALDSWIHDVWTRYTTATDIPACWPWHPDAVADLLACQAVWSAAVREGAGPESLAGWHDRWRPGTAVRVDRSVAACVRSAGYHVEGIVHYRADPAHLDEVAVWWATSHGRSPAPGLTLVERV